jgi:hypothetical protein
VSAQTQVEGSGSAERGRVETCAHPACSCAAGEGEGIRARGQLYCSRGCAEGYGCDHESCNCIEEEKVP